jgi:GxxExxY protein
VNCTSRDSASSKERRVPVVYKGFVYPNSFRADLVVNDMLVVEIKSAKKLDDTDHKQVRTYLKLSGYKLGLLMNFGTPAYEIRRIVNGLEETRKPVDGRRF